MALVEHARLRLRQRTESRRNQRWTEPLTPQYHRLVEVDELRGLVELELRERERQLPPPEQRRGEPLAAKARELLGEARDRAVGEVEAAVELWVVVPALALVW